MNPSISEIVKRITHILNFCNYVFLIKNRSPIEAQKTIADTEIQTFIFYD